MKNAQTAIIYKTKHYTTKKYAGWLAMKIDSDLYELSDIRNKDIEKYKNILFGSYIENGHLKGINFIKKNYKRIQDKNLVIFAVGLGLYNDQEILNINFSEDYEFKNLKIVQLPGDFNYKKLSLIDKFKIKYIIDRKDINMINNKNNIINCDKANIDKILKIFKQTCE